MHMDISHKPLKRYKPYRDIRVAAEIFGLRTKYFGVLMGGVVFGAFLLMFSFSLLMLIVVFFLMIGLYVFLLRINKRGLDVPIGSLFPKEISNRYISQYNYED